MAQLQLCRERVEITESTAILSIHSNRAGNNEGYTDGHAWVSVYTETRTIYLGLWPDIHEQVSNKDPDCSDVRVGMEAGQRPVASRYYRIGAHQIKQLNVVMNDLTIWRVTNTCAAWAVKVLRDVVGVPISAVDIAIFSTPRKLGTEIQKLERADPSSLQKPATYTIERNPFWMQSYHFLYN